jgi:hypothetical protein
LPPALLDPAGDGTRLDAAVSDGVPVGDGDFDNEVDGGGPVELDAGGDDEPVEDRVGEPLLVPVFVLVPLLDPGDPTDGLGDEPLRDGAGRVACG